MTLAFYKIHDALAMWLLGSLLFIGGSVYGNHATESHNQVTHTTSDQKKITKRESSNRKILGCLAGSTLTIFITLVIVYKRYFTTSSQGERLDQNYKNKGNISNHVNTSNDTLLSDKSINNQNQHHKTQNSVSSPTEQLSKNKKPLPSHPTLLSDNNSNTEDNTTSDHELKKQMISASQDSKTDNASNTDLLFDDDLNHGKHDNNNKKPLTSGINQLNKQTTFLPSGNILSSDNNSKIEDDTTSDDDLKKQMISASHDSKADNASNTDLLSDDDLNHGKHDNSNEKPLASGINQLNKQTTPLLSGNTLSSDNNSNTEDNTTSDDELKKQTISASQDSKTDDNKARNNQINQEAENNSNQTREANKIFIKKKIGFELNRNSCFMDSTLQVLIDIIPPLISGGVPGIIEWQQKLEGDISKEAAVTRAFSSLVEDMYANNRTEEELKPLIQEKVQKLRKALGGMEPEINAGVQSSAKLVTETLINAIDTALKKKSAQIQREYSYEAGKPPTMQDIQTIVTKISSFYHKKPMRALLNNIKAISSTCTDCGAYYNLEFTSDYYINFKVNEKKKSIPLIESINTNQVILRPGSHASSEKCTREEVIEQTRWLLPADILILECQGDWKTKVNQVSYPLDNGEFIRKKYFLKAIIINSGKESNGHYISLIKDSHTQEWWEYDNQTVKKAKKEYVENAYEYSSDFGTSSVQYLIYTLSPFESSKTISIPLWKGGLQRVPFDPKNLKWVQGHKDLEKIWDTIQGKINNGHNIDILAQDLYDRFLAYSKAIVGKYGSVDKLSQKAEEVIQQFQDKVERNSLVQNYSWLLNRMSKELKEGPLAEKSNNLHNSDSDSDSDSDSKKNRKEFSIKRIERNLRRWMNLSPSLNKGSSSSVKLNSTFRIPLKEHLITLKSKIIDQLEKLKNQEETNPLTLSTIEQMLYQAIEAEIIEKFLENASEQEMKWYAYLDLVDYILSQLGYAGLMF